MTDRTHEQAKAALAETERKIAHNLGKLEAAYEAMPRDEALIAEAIAETGASRDTVVERLQAIAERELTRLFKENSASRPSNHTSYDATVARFRELLSDEAT